MASPMNFKAAPEWLKKAAIARRQAGKAPLPINVSTKPRPAATSGGYKPSYTGLPHVPGITTNKNENAVLEGLYESNAKAYNKTKTGKAYKSKYIKTGDG